MLGIPQSRMVPLLPQHRTVRDNPGPVQLFSSPWRAHLGNEKKKDSLSKISEWRTTACFKSQVVKYSFVKLSSVISRFNFAITLKFKLHRFLET